MLALERVNCRYAKVHVLHDVSLTVGAGEIVCMIGPNAAGKTTTLRVIAGLKEASGGHVRYLDEDITRLLPFERAERGLVLVPGAADLPQVHGAGQSPHGRLSAGRPRGHRRRPRAGLRALPTAPRAAAAARGLALGRRAADAGHRARAHGAPQV